MMHRAGLVVALLMATAPALAAPSSKDADAARKLMREGDALFAANEYDRALDRYQAADAIMHVPPTGVAVAKAHAALGHLVEARDLALAVARARQDAAEPRPFTAAREEAKELAKQLANRIPSVEISIEGASPEVPVRVTIDGNEVPPAAVGLPRKLNPGAHTIVAIAPGFKEARAVVMLKEGASEKVPLRIDRAQGATPAIVPSSKPHPKPPESMEPKPARSVSPLVYVGFGVGAAGLAVGSVTGLMSLSKASKAKDQCDGTRCPSSAQSDIDSSKSLATISNISFGVAIVGTAVGVYGLLSSKKRTESPPAAGKLTPIVGPRWIGVSSAF